MTTTPNNRLPEEVLRLSPAQISMLHSHEMVEPRPVAWTYDLGSKRTWDWLYANGLLRAGRITEKGRTAIKQATGGRDV